MTNMDKYLDMNNDDIDNLLMGINIESKPEIIVNNNIKKDIY